jgi:hypothetical protein
MTDAYNNCDQIDQASKKCTKCNSLYYMPIKDGLANSDVCCNILSFNSFDYADYSCQAATNIANCVQYEINKVAKCEKCATGYYLKSDKTACYAMTQFLDTGDKVLNEFT